MLNDLESKRVVERKQRATILDPFKEYIEIQAAKELSATRIYQDVVKDDYAGSYDTVKRYISKIKDSPHVAYMVMHSLPGEEAQLDFGYIGTIKSSDVRRKKSMGFCNDAQSFEIHVCSNCF